MAVVARLHQDLPGHEGRDEDEPAAQRGREVEPGGRARDAQIDPIAEEAEDHGDDGDERPEEGILHSSSILTRSPRVTGARPECFFTATGSTFSRSRIPRALSSFGIIASLGTIA